VPLGVVDAEGIKQAGHEVVAQREARDLLDHPGEGVGAGVGIVKGFPGVPVTGTRKNCSTKSSRSFSGTHPGSNHMTGLPDDMCSRSRRVIAPVPGAADGANSGKKSTTRSVTFRSPSSCAMPTPTAVKVLEPELVENGWIHAKSPPVKFFCPTPV